MKWYEFSDDCGDGTTRRMRFRTREEAQVARDFLEETGSFLQDGDGSPVEEVDTDCEYFYDNIEDIKEQYA